MCHHSQKNILTFFFIAFVMVADLSAEVGPKNKNISEQSGQAVLYFYPNCTHCKEVEAYLKSINKTIVKKNITNPQYHVELNALEQKAVPVLLVNGEVIVGSTSIIAYLKKHPEVLRS
jgi:glutaredoxin